MQTTARISQEKPKVVMKVSIIDTFRSISVGASAEYDCRVVGSLMAARAAVTRLNQYGEGEWAIVTDDNGAHYTVTRSK